MKTNFKFVEENNNVINPLEDVGVKSFFDFKPSGFVEDTRNGKKYKFWFIKDADGTNLRVADIELENALLLPNGEFDEMDDQIIFFTDETDTIDMVIRMIGCYKS